MTAKKGSNLVLQIETSTDVWESIPGERVSSYTLNNESVDTTAKSQTSRELSACGLKTVSITASGIVKDDLSKTLFNTLCEASLFNTIRRFRIMSGIEIPIRGHFLVSSFARNGEYNNAEQWNLTLESADLLDQSIGIPIPPVEVYHNSCIFSVRKIVDSYAGKCLRVRRSSDNVEQDIGFVNGWLDEVSLLAFVGSGDGFVTAWYNQTPQYGLVRFIQPDASKQPPLVSSGVIYKRGITGRPYLRFDGTQYLRNETPGDIKNIMHYNRMHGMFVGSNYTGTQGGYLGAAFSIGRYSWGAILSMTSETYGKHRIVDFMAVSRIRRDGRYENPATLYPPDLNNFPEFISLAMTVRENHIRMRWKSERMGDYYADYPPLSQSLDPVYDNYDFYSTIGCSSVFGSFARYGIQEVIIQSIDWDVATVDQMLSNQEWEFR